MMKNFKYITSLMTLFLSVFACEMTCHAAEEYFEENGIRYLISKDKKYCTVVKNSEAPYSGIVEIPAYAGGYPVTGIEPDAFNQCRQLTEILIGDNVTSFSNLNFEYCESLEKVVLPETFSDLGTRAFLACVSLKEINLPEGIYGIPMETFLSCISLESIEIPENATYIDMGAFEGSGIRNLNVPDRVASIGSNAFSSSSLESIHIGKGLLEIGDRVFAQCKNLKDVFITAPEPPVFDKNLKLDYDAKDLADIILYVPQASIEKYQESEYWSLFKEIRSIESSGIDEMESDQVRQETIYDMQGRRLRHTEPGINIVNGKKVIISSTR